jgi:hypothetical protein
MTYTLIVNNHSDEQITICKGRRANEQELEKVNPEYKDLMFVMVGDEDIMDNLSWQDMPKRQSDGRFFGCSNSLWIISNDELQNYIAINNARTEAKRNERINAIAEKIAELEAMPTLPTREEARAKMKAYKDTMNDGGYGYVPYIPCKDDLEEYKNELKKLMG